MHTCASWRQQAALRGMQVRNACLLAAWEGMH
jgi:hypothetical protein